MEGGRVWHWTTGGDEEDKKTSPHLKSSQTLCSHFLSLSSLAIHYSLPFISSSPFSLFYDRSSCLLSLSLCFLSVSSPFSLPEYICIHAATFTLCISPPSYRQRVIVERNLLTLMKVYLTFTWKVAAWNHACSQGCVNSIFYNLKKKWFAGGFPEELWAIVGLIEH